MSEKKRSPGKSATERAESVVADLARRGEVRARDLRNLVRTLADRAERNRTEMARLIQKEVSRQVKALGLARREEVNALRKRISDLENSKARSRPAAKKR